MKRRAYIIGILAAGLALAGAFGCPEYARVESSARSFQQHFREMKSEGGSLGPVERFVYSLILANNSPEQTAKPAVRPEPRT